MLRMSIGLFLQPSAFTIRSVATQLECWSNLFLLTRCPSWCQAKHIKCARTLRPVVDISWPRWLCGMVDRCHVYLAVSWSCHWKRTLPSLMLPLSTIPVRVMSLFLNSAWRTASVWLLLRSAILHHHYTDCLELGLLELCAKFFQILRAAFPDSERILPISARLIRAYCLQFIACFHVPLSSDKC